MDQRLPLSVAIITQNEEANLPRCLESVRGLASEIVVIDSGSTDRTAEVARSYGAVFETAAWKGFLGQKSLAFSRCTQPWVLNLDADEALTPELAESIRQALGAGDGSVSGYWVNRRTYFMGDWVWHAWYPEWVLRLVRRETSEWAGLDPHPALRVRGGERRLSGDLLHYSFKDLADHLHRTLRYARTTAQSYAARGRRFHWYQLVFSPWLAFLKHLFLKQGWRDGWRGWIIACSKWMDVFAKYAYLLEEERFRGPRN